MRKLTGLMIVGLLILIGVAYAAPTPVPGVPVNNSTTIQRGVSAQPRIMIRAWFVYSLDPRSNCSNAATVIRPMSNRTYSLCNRSGQVVAVVRTDSNGHATFFVNDRSEVIRGFEGVRRTDWGLLDPITEVGSEFSIDLTRPASEYIIDTNNNPMNICVPSGM